uniref:Uncharacterized protein n=1 Tax=Fagus sylvatica TaxID=28930 RepID=A0A2N9GCF5_FAGSY
MAPGSRGAGAVFVCFSSEDSGQTGDAIGEPRFPRRSWSRHLSNSPRLAGQLVASRKDSAHEGGCPEGEMRFIRGNPSLGSRDMVPRTEATGVFLVRLRTVFRSGFRLDPEDSARKRDNVGGKVYENFNTTLFHQPVFIHVVNVVPDVGFRRSWCRRKAHAAYFLKVWALHRGELGSARYVLVNRGRWNVPYSMGSFSDRNSGLTGGALNDPGVARCSRSDLHACGFQLAGQVAVGG